MDISVPDLWGKVQFTHHEQEQKPVSAISLLESCGEPSFLLLPWNPGK